MPLLGWFDALLLTTLLITIVCIGGWIVHDALRYRHERRLERMRINERIDRRLFAGEEFGEEEFDGGELRGEVEADDDRERELLDAER